MAMKGDNPRTIILPCIFCISWKVQKGLKSNLVY